MDKRKYVVLELARLAQWDVLMDLSSSLSSAAAEEAMKGTSVKDFERAWEELVGLAFSDDSVDLIWERYTQLENDEKRRHETEKRYEAWMDRHSRKGGSDGNS